MQLFTVFSVSVIPCELKKLPTLVAPYIRDIGRLMIHLRIKVNNPLYYYFRVHSLLYPFHLPR